jgi:ABC-type polysaccharide/polyol phosphate export permease
MNSGMTTIELTPSEPLRRLLITAAQDLAGGLRQWRLWGRLGWLEVRRRYSRTVIGPFWSAISLAMFVLALGSVGTGLWNKQASEYVPFLAAGMVVWVTMSTIIVESCALFISGSNMVRQMQFNYSVMVYALVWRNFIVFAHNLIVFVLACIVFGKNPFSWATVLVVPGLALLIVNCVWISLLLGMFCLRFRDVQQLVAGLIQIAMFVTPIFWPPEDMHAPWHVVSSW